MPINYLNEVIANTFQIIFIGSLFTLASKFILNMSMPLGSRSLGPKYSGFGSLFSNDFNIYSKRIAPEKISLSGQKTYRRIGGYKDGSQKSIHGLLGKAPREVL